MALHVGIAPNLCQTSPAAFCCEFVVPPSRRNLLYKKHTFKVIPLCIPFNQEFIRPFLSRIFSAEPVVAIDRHDDLLSICSFQIFNNIEGQLMHWMLFVVPVVGVKNVTSEASIRGRALRRGQGERGQSYASGGTGAPHLKRSMSGQASKPLSKLIMRLAPAPLITAT